MDKSTSITELAKALAKFQAEVPAIGKDSENPFFHSKYASLENIIEKIRKPLADNGLSFSQFPNGENLLVTTIMHVSGEFMSANAKMTPKDTSPQSQGSAITYMRRYALSAMLGLATEEDDDGNQASTSKPTIVKPVKADGMDAYAKAADAIDKAKTIPAVFKVQERIEKSANLTAPQKDKLDKMVSSKVDLIENTNGKDNENPQHSS